MIRNNIIVKIQKLIIGVYFPSQIPRSKQAPIIKRHYHSISDSITSTHRLRAFLFSPKPKFLRFRGLKNRHESPQRSQSVRWRTGQSIFGMFLFLSWLNLNFSLDLWLSVLIYFFFFLRDFWSENVAIGFFFYLWGLRCWEWGSWIIFYLDLREILLNLEEYW